ncbi:uncharacterized protein LOC119405732 [Rhipicephalus sanguineus]|uniref:uncharacterized protein LOC119405732 n=1 Tax=Rhipicephalus sanguineus TaxID=34632 RepID=UPI0020C4ACAE|nr:uncharacterized protein LOC119405732 [Rhipicephalus sanguineus]
MTVSRFIHFSSQIKEQEMREHIKKLLKDKDNAMSFLGAKVTSRSLADKLVEELLEHLGSNVDTVIVESYIAPTGSVGCRVFPTSVVSGLTYEEPNLPSLYKKYMPKYSDGWALYDVDMDKLYDCPSPFQAYERISRTRVVVADRSNTDVPVNP